MGKIHTHKHFYLLEDDLTLKLTKIEFVYIPDDIKKFMSNTYRKNIIHLQNVIDIILLCVMIMISIKKI